MSNSIRKTAPKLSVPFSVRTLLGIWLGWRLLSFVLAAVAPVFLPFTISFTAFDLQEAATLPQYIEKFANFDGGLYLTLIHGGYRSADLLQAFFPLYPLLSSLLSSTLHTLFEHTLRAPIWNYHLLSALLISSLSALGMLLVFRQYFIQKKVPYLFNHFILVLLLYPYSFYFLSIYTESLFGIIMMSCWILFFSKRWVWLSVVLALATATRLVGVFLIPAMLLDLWLPGVTHLQLKASSVLPLLTYTFTEFLKKYLKQIALICMGLLGLAAFMMMLYFEFNDPLKFYHVQKDFGAGRESRLILYPQVFWRYMKIFYTARPFDLKYLTYVQEFSFTQIALVGLIAATVKRQVLNLTWGELLFSFAAFLLPTLTGNFSSMGRYVMVCYPVFILMAYYLHKYPRLKYLYYPVSLFILLVNMVMFFQGRWVA